MPWSQFISNKQYEAPFDYNVIYIDIIWMKSVLCDVYYRIWYSLQEVL